MSALKDDYHKSRFERAKAFSDYLGFHIRLAFFGIVGVFALAIPVSRMISELSGGPPYRPTDHFLELTVMAFCFSLSAVMLYHIFGVGRTYFRYYINSRIIRFAILPLYWILTLGSLSAISLYGAFQLLSTLGVDPYKFECLLNNYLGSTNYPLTPAIPERCL
ncbi:hypothetical protein [Hoeflea sp.]|uniref:hypothetical protein n=1 Tax=Hoeflea sp. TaxID=1940281 RepID=UPI003749B427